MAPDEQPAPSPREPYVAPAVDRIRIVQNEMAVAACKGATHGVAVARSCRVSICRNAGS
jgi:hypothetical protein